MLKKWGLILKAFLIVTVFLAGRGAIEYFNLDLISTIPIVTALVGAVIFTLAIIFTGTLADYKESERMPGELSTSIRTLYSDLRLVCTNIPDKLSHFKLHLKELAEVINLNFGKEKAWSLREVNAAIRKMEEDIEYVASTGVPPPFIVRMRAELTNIDRISHRVDTIIEANFLPVAYYISEIAVALSLVTLMFTKIDPYSEGLALFGFSSFLLISLVLMIKAMDNPFSGYVKIDLSQMHKLGKYLESEVKGV